MTEYQLFTKFCFDIEPQQEDHDMIDFKSRSRIFGIDLDVKERFFRKLSRHVAQDQVLGELIIRVLVCNTHSA